MIDIEAGKNPGKVVKGLRRMKRRFDQGAIRRRPSITLRNAKMFMDGVQQVPAQTAGLLSHTDQRRDS